MKSILTMWTKIKLMILMTKRTEAPTTRIKTKTQNSLKKTKMTKTKAQKKRN